MLSNCEIFYLWLLSFGGYKMRFIKIMLLCILISALLIGCSPKINPSKPLKKTNYLLGTLVEITLYDSRDEKIIDEVFDRIREIENKMTINIGDTSEIIKLNEASGMSGAKISPDTFFVIEKGKYYSELSEGHFDITIGPVVKLWNIGTDDARIPDSKELSEALNLVDYKKLHLNKERLEAKLDVKGMKVDLGAIAKGYAADEAASILKRHGIKHAIINLGGNLLAIGNNINGNPYRIGVQNPFNPRGDYMGIIEIEDKTVVTSGIYEKYLEKDGKRYHHILEPSTGYPADNGLAGVSIITEKSIDGDGLSTSVFLLGLEKGMELIEKLPNVEAIFITVDKKVYLSKGIKDSFTLTNTDYIIAD